MRALLVGATLAILLGAGCKKADAQATGTASSSKASPGAAPATEVDFEEEADAQIHAGNAESELDALEKEIAADAP